ncbi:hypothetical protein KIN20_006299 [Parelaphostrongylus tenuis]|uniref:Uncharacterized protein n=1 Tax=Parelaphostrongylus tenuis TaxID=148309 RepID=A0AAD5QGK2_PARTN|nr:hypothetical protein KIN20_006299 [Parelaphostrongylus tenuis]
MQVAYGNCQKVADEKAFDAWGDELKSAIYTGQIDLLKAGQETCRRGAERQQCGALRRAISNCEIMESIQIGAQLQRAMKRCEEMGGLLDQNPLVILAQINSLVGDQKRSNGTRENLSDHPFSITTTVSVFSLVCHLTDTWLTYTMLLVSTLLVFAIVEGTPTTTKPVTTLSVAKPVTTLSVAKPVTTLSVANVSEKVHVVPKNGTDLANRNDSSHMGLRDSLAKDIEYLRSKYENVRQGFDDWMDAPYHRDIVIPVLIGIMSAGTVLILYCFVRNLSQRCMKRFSRTRISYMSRDYEGEKKQMMAKRDESDDDM